MSIPIKSDEEIALMRKSGQILAATLSLVCEKARPGISTYELDQIAEEFILSQNAKPAFKGYHDYPKTLCVAVDEEIVHGIPKKDKILHEGNLFTVDCGVIYQGMYTDAARSIGIGLISPDTQRLIEIAKRALAAGINNAKPGKRIGAISKAIQEVIEKNGYYVIYNLTGHGIGHKLHEPPTILNYFDGKEGEILKPGMTIAIEPIFSAGTNEMETLEDGWTIVTDDRSLAIQEEHTILITQSGNEILTI